MILRFKPGKKKCACCGAKFDKDINQPFKNWCSVDCAYKLSKILRDKKEKKEWAVEKKVMKENILSHSDWLKKLEDEINPISRLIDFGCPCISCKRFGKPQAGHYHSVGSDGTLRFNLHNIHLQDYLCNVQYSANIPGYDEGLIQIYGRSYWEYVKFGLKNTYFKPLKLSIPQIKTLIEKAKEIKKNLQILNLEYSPQERIFMRDDINLQLGMYNERFL